MTTGPLGAAPAVRPHRRDAAGSTAPAAGSTTPAAGSTTPAAGSATPAAGSTAPAAGSAAPAPAGLASGRRRDALRRPAGLLAAVAVASALLVAVSTATTAAAAPTGATAATAAAAPAAATARAALTSSATCSSTPFRTNTAKKQWFRLPSIARTTAGTLVAFAERRDSPTNGIGNFDVVTARSTDGGCSWSAYRVIGDDARNRVSNAVPIVDRTNGWLYLFSSVLPIAGSGGSGRGTYMQVSKDDGKTFSPLLRHRINPRGFNGGLTGPGHGIQLSVTHPGRLVVPMGYRTNTGLFGAYAVYSDDHGASWQLGYRHDDRSGVEYVEGTAAELPDGELYLSYRNGNPKAKVGDTRYYARSADGGASLSQGFRRQAVNILSIEGSTLSLRGASDDLLFSAPANLTRRNDLAIFISSDGGATWPRRYQVDLQDTPGAYSDLVQIDPDTIGVVYETGTEFPKDRVRFTRVAVADLTNPTLVASQLTYYRSAHPTLTSSTAKVKVTVKVKGVSSPPGKVTLRYTGAGGTGARSADLAKFHQGTRVISLPKLRRGNYKLTLTYSGTSRIKKVTRSAGTLQVITRP